MVHEEISFMTVPRSCGYLAIVGLVWAIPYLTIYTDLVVKVYWFNKFSSTQTRGRTIIIVLGILGVCINTLLQVAHPEGLSC